MCTRILAGLTTITLLLGCGGDVPRGYSDGDSQGVTPGLVFSDGAIVADGSQGDGGLVPKDDADTGAPACGPDNCAGCCNAEDVCLAGTSNILCGSLGAPCADCTAGKGLCESSHCTSCTPDCDGKTCGGSDGCGSSCEAGSGCCTPDCKGKTCGASNGCGGSCKAGSGCCTPTCSGKTCGDSNGCGGSCKAGSGCCTPKCSGKACGDPDGCGGKCAAGGQCCTPDCKGKTCGDSDGCGGKCAAGSGCCAPDCQGKTCGASDGCGGTCTVGSGCCTPTCSGKLCGDSNGCGGSCKAGSGCCTPTCSGKLCGASDGCGGKCSTGSGCCTPDCSGAICGIADGCGGKCEVGSGCCTPKCQGKVCGSLDGCGRVCAVGSGCCVQTGAETLDGKDNNCDGNIDEGYWANLKEVSYATLHEYTGCSANTYPSFEYLCAYAADQYCIEQGYVGGFGPVERTATHATIVCVADASLRTTVMRSKLATAYPPCTTSKDAQSPECIHAVHEYCKDRGYASGFGPVKDAGIWVNLVCIKSGHGQYGGINLSILQRRHAGCVAPDLLSQECRAAVHRTCNSYTDYHTGFGLVDGANIRRVCLKTGPTP